jgi:SAM-dependent methyltransferase
VTSKKAIERKTLGLDKYKYYEKSVQNVGFDVEFVRDQYKHFRGKAPRVLREDFCGTGKLMCEWVKDHKDNVAFGLDLDPEPVNWGKEKHYAKLNDNQQKRVTYNLKNVLAPIKERPDAVGAFNFSYFIFKERKTLLEYFKAIHKNLKDDGMFFLDIFGGPESQTLQVEETEHDKFSYYWDCDKFNPLTHDCLFHIHFKVKGKKYREAFTYDWRFWTLPEVRDVLLEAGFSDVKTYWEGDDEEGGGDGEFYLSNEEENCESWVTYIAAIK